jgi:hypothetical protein
MLYIYMAYGSFSFFPRKIALFPTSLRSLELLTWLKRDTVFPGICMDLLGFSRISNDFQELRWFLVIFLEIRRKSSRNSSVALGSPQKMVRLILQKVYIQSIFSTWSRKIYRYFTFFPNQIYPSYYF